MPRRQKISQVARLPHAISMRTRAFVTFEVHLTAAGIPSPPPALEHVRKASLHFGQELDSVCQPCCVALEDSPNVPQMLKPACL